MCKVEQTLFPCSFYIGVVCYSSCLFLWNLVTAYLAISTNQNKVKLKTPTSRLVGDFYWDWLILYVSLDSWLLYIIALFDHKHGIALRRKVLQGEIGNMGGP